MLLPSPAQDARRKVAHAVEAMAPATLTLTMKGPAGVLAAAIPRPYSRGRASTTTLHLSPMPQHTEQVRCHLSTFLLVLCLNMPPEPCLLC